MEAKTNYTLVGLMVILLGASLLGAIVWLSSGFNQKQYNTYTVYMREPAAGLSEEALVKFNGVQVGYVKKIKLNAVDPRQVELILNIEKYVPITTSTFATLTSQGITGVTHVGLSAGSSDLTKLKKLPGEPYPVIPAKPSLFNQLDAIVKDVSLNVNIVSKKAQLVFNEENAQYIKNTLANLEQFSTVLAKNSKQLNGTVKSANVFFSNMATASRDLPEMMQKIKMGGQNLSDTMLAGKNAVNKISEQALPPAIALLNKLNTVAANLERVSNALRENPSVLLRGSQAPKPGPGE